MMRALVRGTCALAATAGITTAGAQVSDPQAGAGVVMESYKFGSAQLTNIDKISLFTVPIVARANLLPQLDLTVNGAFASANLTRPNGTSTSLSGLTDTEIRLTYTTMGDRVRLSAVGLAPTGKSKLSADEKEIGRERHVVAQRAAEHLADRNAPRLAEDVEARELDRRHQLRSLVVERRGGVGDSEAHLLEPRRVVSEEVGLEPIEGGDRAFAAAAHFAESDQSVIGLDFDDRAHEPAPVAPVGVTERRGERHADGGSPDIDDLHASAIGAGAVINSSYL